MIVIVASLIVIIDWTATPTLHYGDIYYNREQYQLTTFSLEESDGYIDRALEALHVASPTILIVVLSVSNIVKLIVL